MKDIEDKLAKFLMEYGVLKNRDAENMARKIAEMFEKEREELQNKLTDLQVALDFSELACERRGNERDHLSIELDKLRCAYGNVCDNAAITEKERDELKRKYGFTYCAYCGTEFQIDAPESVDAVSKHIATCEKHPMRLVEKERDQLAAKYADMSRVLSEIDEMIRKGSLELVDLLNSSGTKRQRESYKSNIYAAAIRAQVFRESDSCGKGWLSPERKERLRRKLICLKDVVCTEDSALVQEALDEIK